MRWFFWVLDGFLYLLFMAADAIAWSGRKMLGYCDPECNPLRLMRVDGMGDNPDTVIFKCRKCGRTRERARCRDDEW